MTISIIAAVSENNVIGADNKLIWHISEDLKRFKKLTLNKVIIMGRKTYESLPVKPLPDRRTIVISSKTDLEFKNVMIANSPQKALELCKSENEIFICGGEQIYKEFIEKADKIYLTRIHAKFEGDAYFPKFNEKKWKIRKTEDSQGNDLKYSFIEYSRN